MASDATTYNSIFSFNQQNQLLRKLEDTRRTLAGILVNMDERDATAAEVSKIKQNLMSLDKQFGKKSKDRERLFGNGNFASFKKSMVGRLIIEEIQKSELLNVGNRKQKKKAGSNFQVNKIRDKKLASLFETLDSGKLSPRVKSELRSVIKKGKVKFGRKGKFTAKAKAGSLLTSAASAAALTAVLAGDSGISGLLKDGLYFALAQLGLPDLKIPEWMTSTSKFKELIIKESMELYEKAKQKATEIVDRAKQTQVSFTGNPQKPGDIPSDVDPWGFPREMQQPVNMPKSSNATNRNDSPLILTEASKEYKDLKDLPQTPAVRNINPGNVTANTERAYLGQTGLEKRKDGKGYYARFATKEAGVAAIVNRLFRYNDPKQNASDSIGGKQTLREIIHVYAPKSENNTDDYINFLSKKTGIGPDEKFSLREHPEILNELIPWIIKREDHNNAKSYTKENIEKGIEIGISEQTKGKEKTREEYKEYLHVEGEPKYVPPLGEPTNLRKSPPIEPINDPYKPQSQDVEVSDEKMKPVNLTPRSAPLEQLNKTLFDYTQEQTGKLEYGFNGEKGENGKIDCSGWVQLAMKRAGISSDLLGLLQGKNSADQILDVAKWNNSLLETEELNQNVVKEGTLVGVKNSAGREDKKKIGHIGIVLRNPDTGDLGVSHASVSRGVYWEPLPLFQRDFGKYGFVIADPFRTDRGAQSPLLTNNPYHTGEDFSFRSYLTNVKGLSIYPMAPKYGLDDNQYDTLLAEYKQWRDKNYAERSRPYEQNPNYSEPLQSTYEDTAHTPEYYRPPFVGPRLPEPTVEPIRTPAGPSVAVKDNTEREDLYYRLTPPNSGPQLPEHQLAEVVAPGVSLPQQRPIPKPKPVPPIQPGTIPDAKPVWTSLFEGVSESTRNLFTELGDVFS